MKIKKINKGITIGFIFGIFFLLLVSYADAFAVSSMYSKGHPLVLYPGDNIDMKLVLQNMVGGSEIIANGVISQGSEMAQITDASTRYTIPLGEKRDVNIRIQIPKNITKGNHTIITTFTTVNSQESGNLGLGSSIEQQIPIVIMGKPGTVSGMLSSNSWLIYIIGIVVLMIIILLLIKRSKSK